MIHYVRAAHASRTFFKTDPLEDAEVSRFFPRPDFCITSTAHLHVAVKKEVIFAPAFLHGMKVLFASDFHMRPEMNPCAIAEQIAACKADLILFGGDFADECAQALRLFDAFKGLRAPLGIFSARGNNDTEAFGDVSSMKRALNSFGAELLVNRSIALDLPGGRLTIGGADEYRHSRPNCAAALSGDSGYRILLSHYPILPDPSLPQPDLLLSGHTHGGQFNFLGITPYAIGFERSFDKKHLAPARVSGTETIGPTTLLVSKGIGMSRIPLRVGVRSEIHLIEFSC